jgi:hypothetical protein
LQSFIIGLSDIFWEICAIVDVVVANGIDVDIDAGVEIVVFVGVEIVVFVGVEIVVFVGVEIVVFVGVEIVVFVGVEIVVDVFVSVGVGIVVDVGIVIVLLNGSNVWVSLILFHSSWVVENSKYTVLMNKIDNIITNTKIIFFFVAFVISRIYRFMKKK